MDDPKTLQRRELLRATAAGLIMPGLAKSRPGTGADNPVKSENLKEGASDWQLTRVRINSGQYRTTLVEGFCSHQSIGAGDRLRVFVSTDPPSPYKLTIYRMGYYGGRGARRVGEFGPVDGQVQPTPPIGKERLRQCEWECSFEIEIPDDWPSGVYLGKLSTLAPANRPYWESYIIFIVRDDRPADILFQCSDNTWQAYNRWPLNESLYTHPDGAHAPGVAVSFDRPYGKYCQIFDHPLSIGSGEFLLWEYPLCYWLEKQGYDVSYCSNVDLLDPGTIRKRKVFLSVGHDEYWDLQQYRNIEAAIESGVSLLWLSGNSVYMVSPFAANSSGVANRQISRVASYGPLRNDELDSYGNILGPFEFNGPDERNIIGARSIVPFNGGGDWICTRPDHWLFEATGMQAGDAVAGLVGWEFHGEPDMDRAGMEVIAEGTAWAGGTRPAHWTATIFPGPKGNFVFNASTIFWAQGLAAPPGHIIPWSHFSRPSGPDPRVQQITKNALDRALRVSQI